VIELSPSQVHLLSEARVGHLATADESGAPHVVPVCFAFDGTAIYSVLDRKPKRAALTRLRRVRNIQTNPQVSLVVDHYEEDWRRLWYILVIGEAGLLLDGDQQEAATVLLRQKYPQYRGMDIDQNPVIKITPTRVVSWNAAT
jgi:PPOX class probable F420-dependent enzyme